MEGPRVLWWAEFSTHVAESFGMSCMLYARACNSFYCNLKELECKKVYRRGLSHSPLSATATLFA